MPLILFVRKPTIAISLNHFSIMSNYNCKCTLHVAVKATFVDFDF
jgi:hypothetical protein